MKRAGKQPERTDPPPATVAQEPAGATPATDSSPKGTLILQIPEPPPEAITAAEKASAIAQLKALGVLVRQGV